MTRRNIRARSVAVAVVAALTGGMGTVGAAAATPEGAAQRPYIVQAGTADSAAAAVRAAGGQVVAPLGLIGAVDALLRTSAVARLSATPGVRLTADVPIRPAGGSYRGDSAPAQLEAIGIGDLASSTAGQGTGVALIDTGVVDTPGLTSSHVVRSPDFSGEGNTIDHYGHGTFMAGLIAGNGKGGSGAVAGVAPGATLVSVKVAGADGTTTLGKVIAGIGWAVEHRDAYHIRVLSLAIGANLAVDPTLNPLDAAAEAAWASGITVVAAAGNSGPGRVTSPGDDPWVVTVGASTTTDPSPAPWSGTSATKPDVFAAGVSVTSLRAPGSTIDLANPSARIGGLYFRGSGTSMATALTAGAAALLYDAHPAATPDDIKGAVLAGAGEPLVGQAGVLDISQANEAEPSASWWQHHPIAFNGLGLGLGTSMPWTSASWTSASWTSASWTSASWTSASWTSASWTSASWTSASWTSASWTSASWTSASWTTQSWG